MNALAKESKELKESFATIQESFKKIQNMLKEDVSEDVDDWQKAVMLQTQPGTGISSLAPMMAEKVGKKHYYLLEFDGAGLLFTSRDYKIYERLDLGFHATSTSAVAHLISKHRDQIPHSLMTKDSTTTTPKDFLRRVEATWESGTIEAYAVLNSEEKLYRILKGFGCIHSL